jgi:hypothetical protein
MTIVWWRRDTTLQAGGPAVLLFTAARRHKDSHAEREVCPMVKQTRAEQVERSDIDPRVTEPSLTWSSEGNMLQRLWRKRWKRKR